MPTGRWIKVGLILFSLLFLSATAWQLEAWARAGGGGGGRSSMGSRGSRSMSPPKTYSPSPSQPGKPSQSRPTPQYAPPVSQPSSSGGFLRSFGGGMLGGLAGGLLFRSLFGGAPAYGGSGGGMGCGGIGLFDLLVLGGILYLIYWYMKRKRTEAMAPGGYQSSAEGSSYQATHAPAYDMSPPPQQGDWDLEQGLGYIRQQDPYFDAAKFQDQVLDIFFKIQGAWANRDLSTARNLLTGEMYQLMQKDVDELKARKEINRLENIAVRSVDVTEAWQESGQDFITTRVYANLLDYHVDEMSGQVVAGSKTDPVKFEEYWTFTRPVGNNPWQLSAIQQAPA